MIIDSIFAVLMVVAIIQGWRRGLILAVFSFVAIIVGLAAAMKLSTVVAARLGHVVKMSDRWLPFISFIVVFIIVVVLIRLGARVIQRLTETAMLGWINRFGGIILYAAIYTTVFSIILFFASQIKLIKSETIQSSVTYPFIRPWGPTVIDSIGVVIPFFRDMFTKLEIFFSGVSQKISAV